MFHIREILLDVIEAILLIVISISVCNRSKFIKEEKIRTILFCILFVITAYWSTLYITNGYHTLIIMIVTVTILSYIIRIPIITSFITFIIFYIILLITELTSASIQSLVTHVEITKIASDPKSLLILQITAKSFQIILVYILYRNREFLNRFKFLKWEPSLYINYMIQIIVFTSLIFCFNSVFFNYRNIKLYNFLILSIYLIYLIAGLKDLKDREKRIQIEANYKIREIELNNLKSINKVISQEKHDFSNHINVIWGLCSIDKPDSLERIKEYVSDISENLALSLKNFNTGNSFVDGLFYIKNNYAVKNEINFKVIIDSSLNLLDTRSDELVSIISNLLDNAFNVLEKKDDEDYKEITFYSYLENKKYIIEIANNGEMIPAEIRDKIFDKGFSTKEKDSDEHGFGLYITKQYVEKNKGTIAVESNEHFTKFIVKFSVS